MPAIRYYRVTETREVTVTGVDPAEAVVNATAVFRKISENPEVDSQGNPLTGPVRTIDISATEE